MAQNTGNSILSAIAGIAIGLGLGVLMAPDQGKKTRKKIKNSFDQTSNELKERINELGKELKAKTNNAKASLEDNIEDLFDKTNYKTEEVISLLEKKLAELKKSDSKSQK